MTIAMCTVSGVIRNNLGNPVAGVTIKANSVRPFIHPTDDSLILNYENTTTTDANGAWSLSLIETETPQITLTFAFLYPGGSNSNDQRYEYTVIIPNTPTALFSTLIGSQI